MILKLPLLALSAVLLINSAPLGASPFSDSYAAYQHAIEVKDIHAAEQYAQQTYLLGQGYFEPDAIDITHLQLNWATSLQAKGDLEAAHQQFLQVLETYRSYFGGDAIEVIDPLLGAAQTMSASKEQKSLFKEAISIAQTSDNLLLTAEVKLLAFKALMSTEYYGRDIRSDVLDAYEIYQQLPNNDIRRITATYYVGVIKASEKRYSDAISHLEEVVKQFAVLDFSHPYKLSAHARLVELYEREGESEQATAHCIAIGSMTPWDDQQEQTPLFRSSPQYPMSYIRAGREGWSEIEFTVDEQGFVQDPVTLASEGGPLFIKESLKAIKQWRYAPKFVDGKPVAAQTTVRLLFEVEG